MRINHNLSALNAWRQITLTDSDMKKTLERLSSGLRINRASDDAAGLAISEKMRGQIRGLEMAMKNAQDAISLIQTAEGALTEVHAILQRMRELAVQAASDTNTNVDRDQIQAELNQLREEIDRIARTTEFNTKKLLDGKLEGFRFKAEVKVVTGGNIDLKAEALEYSVRTESIITLGPGNVNAQITVRPLGGISFANLRLDVGNVTYDWVYQKVNLGEIVLNVGFKSVGNNQVRVQVTREGSSTILGSGTLSSNGIIGLRNIYQGNTIYMLGGLSINFASGFNTVSKAVLVNSKIKYNSLGYRNQDIGMSLASFGMVSFPIINLGGSNATVFQGFNIRGTSITLAFASVGNQTVRVTALRNGQVLGSVRISDTGVGELYLVDDLVSGSTLIDISHITVRFSSTGERVANITIRARAYFDNLSTTSNIAPVVLRREEFRVLAERDGLKVNNNTLTFYTLRIGNYAKFEVGFQSVGSDAVRYVVRSFSGMTLGSGTITRSTFNAYGFLSLNLGDDLVLNFRTARFSSSLNTLSVFVTSRSYNAEEGSYVLEIGQFGGYVSSPIDFRIVKSGPEGLSISTVGELRRGFIVKNGVVLTWMPEIWNINMYGALPKEEVIDAAVFRVDEQRMQDDSLVFQIGSNEGVNMLLGIDDMRAEALGLTKESLDVTTQNAAERTIMIVDAAILKVGMVRSRLGAVQNRLEHTIANLGVAAENLTAAESRIRDADMAKEMMQFTKYQILMQSGMAMLAQSNALPQNVLQLLRG